MVARRRLAGGALSGARDLSVLHVQLAEPDAFAPAVFDRFKGKARTATPDEKPEMWQTMVGEWPAYDEYQQKTDREIPVVVLERA